MKQQQILYGKKPFEPSIAYYQMKDGDENTGIVYEVFIDMITKMDTVNSLSMLLLNVKPKDTVKFIFGSIGGALDVALAIAQAMTACKVPIHGHNASMAASAALLLYSRCDTISMGTHALCMFHGASSGSAGNVAATIERLNALQLMLQHESEFLIEKKIITTEEAKLVSNNKLNLYLTKQDLLDRGVEFHEI